MSDPIVMSEGMRSQFSVELLSHAASYANSRLSRLETDVRALDAKAVAYLALVSFAGTAVAWTLSVLDAGQAARAIFALSLIAAGVCAASCYCIMRIKDVPDAPTTVDVRGTFVELAQSLAVSSTLSFNDAARTLSDIDALFDRSADQIERLRDKKSERLGVAQFAATASLCLFFLGVLLSLFWR